MDIVNAKLVCSVQNKGVGKWCGRERESGKFSGKLKVTSKKVLQEESQGSYTVDVHVCIMLWVTGQDLHVSTSLVQEDANIMHSSMIKFQIKVKITCTFFFFSAKYSWKLLHPTDKYGNPNCPEEAEEYERVRQVFLHFVFVI